MLVRDSKSVFFNEKEFQISYIKKEGSDSLIVFLHGLGANSSYFPSVMKLDGLCGYEQVAIDMIGYGESDKPQDFSYTMMDQAHILKLFLDDYPHENIHLVLHSMAGAMGLYLAEMIKEKIVSISNMEGNLIASDCGIGSKGVSQMSLEDYKIAHEKLITDKENPYAIFMAKADAKSFYLSAIDLVKCSSTGELLEIFNSIDIPKMYIHGVWDRNDELLPMLSKSIKIVEVADTGHGLHMNNLEGFYKELDGFISSIK